MQATSHRGRRAERSAHRLPRFRRAAAILLVLGLALLESEAAAAQEAAGGGEVAVASRDLARGVVLERDDMIVAGNVGGAPVGWITRRVISAGEPLREPAVALPDLVASGDVVQAVWRSGTIELRLVGRAMGSAARGERVQVRIDSKRRLSGVVEDHGLVRIDAGNEAR